MGTDVNNGSQSPRQLPGVTAGRGSDEIMVTLLTGGSDKHYLFGLTTSLLSKGATLDVIGSDELDCPDFNSTPGVNFFNLRGNQRTDAGFASKVSRVLMYYAKLIRYAATAKPKIFHILWNNKFELFDRTLLMLYYRFLGKRIVITAHNVNQGMRDGNDSHLNRRTLRMQYQLANHILVHTEKMKRELIEEFGVPGARVTIIPHPINIAVPKTRLTPLDAKQQLGIQEDERTILFFGRITPYKGLEYLIAAFRQLLAQGGDYRLIVAGRPDRCEKYWAAMREDIGEEVRAGRILLRDEFIPDDETEVYFKAADVLALPYKHIYQSGILFLGHSFGLPVLAADVGSLKDEIVEGKTGLVFKPEDPSDLVKAIEKYFASDLYAELNSRRQGIQDYAAERHSWDVVAQITMGMYGDLLRAPFSGSPSHREVSNASLNMKTPS